MTLIIAYPLARVLANSNSGPATSYLGLDYHMTRPLLKLLLYCDNWNSIIVLYYEKVTIIILRKWVYYITKYYRNT